MNKNPVETIIGAIVIIIAATFFIFAYHTVDLAGEWGGYQISARFDDATGINVGSDVRVAGVKIGAVTKQKLDAQTYQSVITMTLNQEILIPDDSTARITSEGLLGNRFIDLEPGASDNTFNHGDEIDFTQSGIDIWDIVGKYLFEAGNQN